MYINNIYIIYIYIHIHTQCFLSVVDWSLVGKFWKPETRDLSDIQKKGGETCTCSLRPRDLGRPGVWPLALAAWCRYICVYRAHTFVLTIHIPWKKSGLMLSPYDLKHPTKLGRDGSTLLYNFIGSNLIKPGDIIEIMYWPSQSSIPEFKIGNHEKLTQCVLNMFDQCSIECVECFFQNNGQCSIQLAPWRGATYLPTPQGPANPSNFILGQWLWVSKWHNEVPKIP